MSVWAWIFITVAIALGYGVGRTMRRVIGDDLGADAWGRLARELLVAAAACGAGTMVGHGARAALDGMPVILLFTALGYVGTAVPGVWVAVLAKLRGGQAPPTGL